MWLFQLFFLCLCFVASTQNFSNKASEEESTPRPVVDDYVEDADLHVFILLTVITCLVMISLVSFIIFMILEERRPEPEPTCETKDLTVILPDVPNRTPQESSGRKGKTLSTGKTATEATITTQNDVRPSPHPTVRDSRIYMWPRKRRPNLQPGEAVTRLLREMEGKLHELKENHQSMDQAFAENIKQQESHEIPLGSEDDQRLTTCQAGGESVNEEENLQDSVDQTQQSITPDN
ncbi:unnamed protein product [Bursaphelenchus xylophilus]|uniref:(pine wood nematode) hypothetical protein n=1 Tax=Bursaphelenchus xylophilus TaxID=6326 RepID=A0A1I7RSJ1_BURXY|nr:unnamed protein product [Bursaphelenchus xylophilus]CAG9122902.1 unnamed protein product [Bursaphelenchus xylophilus]